VKELGGKNKLLIINLNIENSFAADHAYFSVFPLNHPKILLLKKSKWLRCFLF